MDLVKVIKIGHTDMESGQIKEIPSRIHSHNPLLFFLCLSIGSIKVKVFILYAMRTHGVEVWLHTLLSSGYMDIGVQHFASDPLFLGKPLSLPTEQRAGWTPSTGFVALGYRKVL
jgi:hypothetical protein